ncbi:MAG: site-specific integrase, partial [Ilumatobacteraceae bacterium]|nr:site-specific integrase [Ilumatobacteraceae bacterium]
MKGSMRERRPGAWELIVQLPCDPVTGIAKQLSRTVRGTKRDAQRALAALVTEVSAGKISSSTTTLNQLLVQWLDLVSAQLAATTVREYRRLVATRLAPDLGALTLRRITTQRLDSYYAGLARDRGLAAATVRHHHAVLRGALGQAVAWGWIPTNPAAGASPPKIRRREIAPPPLDVTRQLLAAADDHGPEFGALLRVLAATGARRGEVCGLRWSDINWHTNTLSINRSVASVAGGTIVKDTKTHAARHIAIDTDTMAALARQLERAKDCAVACQLEFDDNSFVFSSTPDGAQPLHPDSITTSLRRLCDKAGLKGVRLHDLRHLHATQLLAAG